MILSVYTLSDIHAGDASSFSSSISSSFSLSIIYTCTKTYYTGLPILALPYPYPSPLLYPTPYSLNPLPTFLTSYMNMSNFLICTDKIKMIYCFVNYNDIIVSKLINISKLTPFRWL